jgi:hypothetical protein
MNNRQQIIDNIISIEDEKEIVIDMLKLEFSTNKYSAKKNSIWHLILNNKNISKKDKFYFKYNCVTCKASHMVATTQMLRKINKGSIHCDFCKPEAIKEHINFEDFDDDFKNNYFTFHLTQDDYSRISKNIKSFHNGKYNINDVEYYPIYNNKMNFTSMLYSKKDNTIFKAYQPIMICDICKCEWRASSIEKFKNCLKIICDDCSVVNTIKIKRFKNINNELILYQSKLELKFINWCNNNNILVVNGPTILNDSNHKYKVNFMITRKECSVLIDIMNKINQEKINAVNNLIKKGEYNKYYLITPLNWMDMIKQIK